MATPGDLMGLGMPPGQAGRLGFTTTTKSGAGTTQGSGTVIYAQEAVRLTVAPGDTAVTLSSDIPINGEVEIYCISGENGQVFPASGLTMDGATDTAVAISVGEAMRIRRLLSGGWRTIGRSYFRNLTVQDSLTVNGTIAVTGTSTLGAVTASSLITGTVQGAAANAVTAFAGGGQGSATQLTGTVARVATVASAADSVKLPAGVAGLLFFLVNGAAVNSMQVFGNGTDTINDVATATGVAQAAGKAGAYFCTSAQPAARWYRVLSA